MAQSNERKRKIIMYIRKRYTHQEVKECLATCRAHETSNDLMDVKLFRDVYKKFYSKTTYACDVWRVIEKHLVVLSAYDYADEPSFLKRAVGYFFNGLTQ